MITERINENEHEIWVYDWIDEDGDYVCGHVKRQPNAQEESDLRYWMFYPAGGSKPLMVGDLKRLYLFMAKLNVDSQRI